MVVKPSDINTDLLPQEEAMVSVVCNEIDAILKGRWAQGRTVEFKLNYNHARPRVVREVAKRYEEAGWDVSEETTFGYTESNLLYRPDGPPMTVRLVFKAKEG